MLNAEELRFCGPLYRPYVMRPTAVITEECMN